MALQVEMWMRCWIGEDIVGFGVMRHGGSVGFGVGIGMGIGMAVGENGRCVICGFGVYLVT